ncbi:MAG TPA: MurR/RpiR family transcriptional regulator [Ilumatobacteraceae bacterium]|nr:MurR/RpiR family transcriptional regulator [Ilumatobacteraceae bacterium]
MDVEGRITEAGAALTTAERRVAEVVLSRPELVAFGTVAELAEAAKAGAATVVRLAAKLGFDGFTALQAGVQAELSNQLRPAAVRIREARGGVAVQRHLERELDNVQATLLAVSESDLNAAARHLADLSASVLVLSGDASYGVSEQFVGDLSALRPGVELVNSNPVAVARRLAQLSAGDVAVAIDLRRYDRWVVDATRQAKSRGAWVLSLSDSALSPLAGMADVSMVLTAGGVGPFDSHVGTMALLNVLVAAAAELLTPTATDRLDRAEFLWSANGELIDR